jgi:hypothetical protein
MQKDLSLINLSYASETLLEDFSTHVNEKKKLENYYCHSVINFNKKSGTKPSLYSSIKGDFLDCSRVNQSGMDFPFMHKA